MKAIVVARIFGAIQRVQILQRLCVQPMLASSQRVFAPLYHLLRRTAAVVRAAPPLSFDPTLAGELDLLFKVLYDCLLPTYVLITFFTRIVAHRAFW